MKPLNLTESIYDIQMLADRFAIPGSLVEGGSFGNGLINDTLVATFENDGYYKRYIFQRINHEVFKDPVSLMDNVERVCTHIHNKLTEAGIDDLDRRALTLLREADTNNALIRDEDGNYWRGYHFIEFSTSFDVVDTEAQAFEAARKFGEFQSLLADLPGDRLAETIPDFHNTPKRFEALEKAIQQDPLGRVADAGPEIEFAISQKPMVSRLIELHKQGLIPERITHNDTKLGNVLLCDKTGKGLCVVDLDTIMPGLTLYDFGDLVRTCVSPGHENDRDTSNQYVRLPMFRALAEGFLEETADILTPDELEQMPFSGRLLTFEVGIRFLTDHILGDPYFGAKRKDHNLERCRTQFALARSLEENEAEMQKIVREIMAARS
ncbi:aminoglycoside phosphotransferase family protein [Sulfuriroseicoccus oceanibius]|uniref:Aminoglycoside phosphotransferase family protein n=1 Tax=Sulfuriroseicoccus oceanibius TaxID=2707525 RepID=A0A6B3LAF0_9BACT|nr:aminoglycoside phosphotransferase family protein [Sulfuriroseicoccus oceanibius]QQL46191.1 aminoglycoside phosphotransferase family protein [Sulfuriroseicoccus oceanibius]